MQRREEGAAPLTVAVPGRPEQVDVGFAFHRVTTPFSLSATTLENIDVAGSAGPDHYGLAASGDDVAPTLSATASPTGTLNGLEVANFGRMTVPLVDHVLHPATNGVATSTGPIRLGTPAANRTVVLLFGWSGPNNFTHRINAATITVDGVDYPLTHRVDSSGGSASGGSGNRYMTMVFDGVVPVGTRGC